MNTNYPVIRLTHNHRVYYARTYNWNSTGVMRGNKADTVFMKVPFSLPAGDYFIEVTANGIASNPVQVHYNGVNFTAVNFQDKDIFEDATTESVNKISVYPNPAKSQTTIQYTIVKPSNVSIQLVNQSGKTMKVLLNKNMDEGAYTLPISISGLVAGIYSIEMITETGTQSIQLLVQ